MVQDQLPLPVDFAREVIDVPVGDEMAESFLAYSLSVITSRAIPDVRDGLKPVQRRILYSMLNMGIRPDTTHRKCARVVGDTMGNFHPHGDSAIYDALVRMGQHFSRNLTLIDPQGNFGSLDEPPAAHRYTECRLTPTAMAMLGELDQETVDFRPTYDGESTEPECLPGLVPNLLVNGSAGIAVGMATNMAPHNLAEVAKLIELVLTKRRPKPTIDELLELVPGPDFPSGGLLIVDDIASTYQTGRGSVTMRAKAHIEQLTRQRQGIIVSELPYLVGPEKVVTRINKLIAEDKLEGVASITNLSDRNDGLRLQIDCEIGVNPQAVLAQLYRLTPLQETFSINNVALVDGVPTTLGLYDLCQRYIEHRLDMIIKRSEFRLTKAKARLHIVEGLLIALDNIDLVISIIRGSDTVQEAKTALCDQLDLSEVQATHILDMQFRRLVGLEQQKLTDEQSSLQQAIADFEALLASDPRRRSVLLAELYEFVETHGRPRRTQILASTDLDQYEPSDIRPEETLDDVEDSPCIITLSTSGNIGRAPAEGTKKATPSRHDLLACRAQTTARANVCAITSDARVLCLPAHTLPETSNRARGKPANQVFGTNRSETLLFLTSPARFDHVVLVTVAGIAKRISYEELQSTSPGGTVLRLKDADKLAAAFACPDDADFIMVTDTAIALRTSANNISVQGRGAGGVAGMALKDNARIIAAGACEPNVWDTVVAIATNQAEAKITPADEIPSKGRATGGVRLTKLRGGASVTAAYVGSAEGLWALMSTDEDHTKLDPTPVVLDLEPTRRDLVTVETGRQILQLAPVRWKDF